MKNKELFFQALNTLFWSFGSEPPAEVIWGANDLLTWFETEYNVKLQNRFSEDPMTMAEDFQKVIEEINSLF
jgi:hypothetical protein